MTLMEGRGFDDVKKELREKFPKTYKGNFVNLLNKLKLLLT